MPTIPKQPRTISQLIPAQLPDFVQEDYPKFVAFLKAYYEWLETSGSVVWTGKVLNTTAISVVLPSTGTTSKSINAYQNMYIVCLNGPAKGQTQKIKEYDPFTKTITLVASWDQTNIPPPNTNMEIRDQLSPEKLIEYRDIDYTLDRFIDYFRNEFMSSIPGNLLADERIILKGIKQLYQAKGTENSFRFLFRIMFDQEVEFYYPKVDLFRTSDAQWYKQKVMKTTTTDNTTDYLNRQVIGVYSGASAKVESVTRQAAPDGSIVSNMTLSSIDGEFTIDPNTGLPEQVKIVYPINPPAQTDLGAASDLLEPTEQLRYENTYQILNDLFINQPGNNYKVGELITISGGGALSPDNEVVANIFQKYYNGSCSIPPSTYYLEPFFGPNDTVNSTEDFTKDGVCIPGMYFFSDVHSEYTDADLLNPTQILLSANEISTDDFFVGDEIAIVGGTGTGQRRTIVSYNGTTKIATVDAAFTDIPDGTTQYSIAHVRGGIKSVTVIDFGLGFVSTPTVTIHTEKGVGAVLPPAVGIIATTSGKWTPGRAGGIGGFPTTPDSFASSNKVIQDSYYWQDFSYDLRFSETIDKYRDAVKRLLHPAGLKMFGSVLLKTKPETNFLQLMRENIIQLEAKLISARIDLKTTTNGHSILQIVSDEGLVLGTTNYTLDAKKFLVFPPCKVWSAVYPDPNASYWSSGLGNTQIAHFKDRTIGSFVNYPNQRINVAYDTDIQIEANHTTPLVGPVVLNTTFSQATRFVLGTVPLIGNEVRYGFLEGATPNTVYNTCPLTIGTFDSTNNGGTWSSSGLNLDNVSFTQSVDSTVVPIHLKQCTVIVVFACTDVSTPQSVLNCVQTANDNGFSMDVVDSALWVRVQSGGTAKFVSFPSMSLKDDKYFMAVLRFDRGQLKGSLNSSRVLATIFANYPANPVANSAGWKFGTSTTDYEIHERTASEFGKALFGANTFGQTPVLSSTISVGRFTGSLAYAYFYDRPLYDYEVDSIFRFLQGELYSRGIQLFGTTNKAINGAVRIQKTAILDTTGISNFVLGRTPQPQLGLARMQQIRNFVQTGLSKVRANITQLGVTRVGQGSIQKMQSGTGNLQASNLPAQHGKGRIRTTVNREAFGSSKFNHTFSYTQEGGSWLQVTNTHFKTGVTKITATTLYELVGNYRIYRTNRQAQIGTTRIQATPVHLQIGDSTIKNVTRHTQSGIAQIYTALTVPAMSAWGTNTQEVTTGPIGNYYTLTPTANTYEAYYATFGNISGTQPFRRMRFHANYKPGTGVLGLGFVAQDGINGSTEIIIDLTYNTVYSASNDSHFVTVTPVGDGSYDVYWFTDLQGTVTLGHEFYPTTLSSHDGIFATGANVQVKNWEVAIASWGENQQNQNGITNII